ncbi:MAG: invasion associated locus B family protein [Magnetovibrio sp.]|nr:invasion associated locus B family protein [Magnetovibrio sp.]
MIRNITLTTFVLILGLGPGMVYAQSLLERGDWQAVKETENGKPVCVMSAEPMKSVGKYTKRGTVLAIISHRPNENRLGEVGFQQGYTLKKGAEATATIDGKTKFKLFGQGGYAWSYDSDADKAIIKAMQAGNKMVVKGTSSRDTLTTDTYSLSGFTAVYNALNKGCGIR